MMMVLYPTYNIRIEIQDRTLPKSHWGHDQRSGKTGCDEVVAAVRAALSKAGFIDTDVFLDRFEYKG